MTWELVAMAGALSIAGGASLFHPGLGLVVLGAELLLAAWIGARGAVFAEPPERSGGWE